MLHGKKSDGDLWNDVRNDDVAAFNELFNRYWLRLYKAAQQQVKTEDASLEIVHDIFVSLWTRRHVLQINKIQAFLLTSVRYQIYTRKKNARLAIVYKADLPETEQLTDVNLGDLKIQDAELQKQFDVFLDELPDRCKEIFVLSRVQQLNNQEIAERLNISKKTVENNITIALKYLRTAFQKTGSLILLLYLFVGK